MTTWAICARAHFVKAAQTMPKSLNLMVGGTGIEPVTPTMSTKRPPRTWRNSAAFSMDRAAYNGQVPPLFTVKWHGCASGNYAESPSLAGE
jgi:hypothetical protein